MPATAASSVGRALRRWHMLIWGAVLLAALLAAGAVLARPPVYEATTLVSIDEGQSLSQGFDVAMQADQFLAQRFISLGNSRGVLQAVCQREGPGCNPTVLGRQVHVTTPKATAQLQVTADASSPQTAARLANETADALIAANRSLVNDQLQPQRAYLQGQLKWLGDQITATLQQTSSADAAGRANAAGVQQLTFLQSQYANTYQRMQDVDVQISQRGSELTVVQRATPPITPIDPDPLRYLLVGTAAGLVVGLLAALVAERLRKRIQYPSELAAAARTDVVVDLSRGGSGAQYGYLARMGRVERPRILKLVASTERDRVNDVARELAQALAARHERVLVMPAPEAGKRARQLEPPSPELVVARDGAWVAPDDEAAEDIDMAIHCALPPLLDPNLEDMTSASDRAVVVATRGKTKFEEARRTADLLRAVGVQVTAALLLPARSRSSPEPAQTQRLADLASRPEVAVE